MIVNTHEAKTHLSRLLARVKQGESFIIAKGGEPVAKLSPVETARRRPGSLRGKIKMKEDFDAPLPESIASAFRGEQL